MLITKVINNSKILKHDFDTCKPGGEMHMM